MAESRTPSTSSTRPRARKSARKSVAEPVASPVVTEPVKAETVKPEPVQAAVEKPEAAKPAVQMAPIDRDQMIATAAYFRAARRQFQPGHELEDWLAAEREIDALLNQPAQTPQ